MPSCFGAVGLVRAIRIPQSENCAIEVQIFCPLILQPPSTLVGLGGARRGRSPPPARRRAGTT